MRNHYIYVLIDPLTNMVRYIGKTDNVRRRYMEHIRECNWTKKKSHKAYWILKLLKNNQKPIVEIIEETTSEHSSFWEMHYISLYRSWGFNLINKTLGGEGSSNYKASDEERTRRSIRTKGEGNTFFGKKHSDETREIMSNKSKERFKDPSNNPMYGRKHKEQSIELMRNNKLGRYDGDKNPNSKELYEYDLNNKLIKVWKTSKECAEYYNLSRGNISSSAKHNTSIDNGLLQESYKIIYKKYLFKFR